jgi:hypothetical protein
LNLISANRFPRSLQDGFRIEVARPSFLRQRHRTAKGWQKSDKSQTVPLHLRASIGSLSAQR